MLTHLHIENFALIDRLKIDFTGGLSIITGETGAGKSILLGALGLALGKRADSTSLRDPDKKCIIEAHFSIAGYQLEPLFEQAGLDYDPHTIIRREILPGGKSRAFVNDSPANLQSLGDLSSNLIDIHSQHETRALSDSDFQFRILDALAGNSRILESYGHSLTAFRSTVSEIEKFRARLADSGRERDYNTFLLTELNEAMLDEMDVAELEAEASMLANMSSILEQMERARQFAEDDQYGFLAPLREFRAVLQKLAPFSNQYEELSERAGAGIIELQDIALELARIAGTLSADPLRLDLVNAKLQLIYNLQRKHHVDSVDELIQVRNNLSREAESEAGLEQRISELEGIEEELRKKLESESRQLSEARRAASLPLCAQIEEILSNLGMPHARFKVDLSPANEFMSNGADRIEFLFAANKGSAFAPMRKVASGGELSRIMLAVKSILAGYAKLPAIIFDEIDTGVSGEIADAMGNIMLGMSRSMQVFAITHLPQIAAKGQRHYKVYKKVSDGGTESAIVLLEGEERIREIAQMLSGSQVSESAINHARALLE